MGCVAFSVVVGIVAVVAVGVGSGSGISNGIGNGNGSIAPGGCPSEALWVVGNGVVAVVGSVVATRVGGVAVRHFSSVQSSANSTVVSTVRWHDVVFSFTLH